MADGVRHDDPGERRVMSEARGAIIEEARKLAVDTLFSEKGQFIAAVWWRRVNYWIGGLAAFFGALAGATILGGGDALLPGLAALGSAALAALNTFLNPSDRASQHHTAGVRYAQLRRRLRQFVQIDPPIGTSDALLKERLDAFTAEIAEIQEAAPPLYPAVRAKAKKEIDAGFSNYTENELETAAGPRTERRSTA